MNLIPQSPPLEAWDGEDRVLVVGWMQRHPDRPLEPGGRLCPVLVDLDGPTGGAVVFDPDYPLEYIRPPAPA